MTEIHPTAVVDRSAEIDETCTIGPYAVIGPDTILGSRCRVGSHCVLSSVEMGEDNVVHPGCYLGESPQDFKFEGGDTRLRLGARNQLREGVTLHRGTESTGETVIGDDCYLMIGSHVGHDCRLGNGVILTNYAQVAGHIHIGDRAVISSMVGLHQHLRVGRLAMVAAGAMVSLDVPPFFMAQGDRATLRGLNVVGLRRAGISRDAIRELRRAYRLLGSGELSLAEALQELRGDFESPEIQELADFYEDSPRGVLRPRFKRPNGAEAEQD